LLDPIQQPADAADLGIRTGCHHQPPRSALRYERARPQHRPAVAQGSIDGDRRLALLHRHRLPGQDRLLYRQTSRLEHAQVGGHLVARLQKNDVPSRDVSAVQRHPVPVAQHGGLRRQQGTDRGHGCFGLTFLDETDDSVRQNHG
jgi:hypothetical protein